MEFTHQGDFCEFSDRSIFPGPILDRSCHQSIRTMLRIIATMPLPHKMANTTTRYHGVKRFTFATALYGNSTLTFRPVIQLIYALITQKRS